MGSVILGFIGSIVLLSLNSARAKSRDAKRLADMRQLTSAIELYNYDKDALPDNLQQLTPIYIAVVPTAPLPPDGTCTSDDNNYIYKKTGKKNYEVTFCLGGATAGLNAGRHIMTPKGIK
jgi:type II secretory pathway pseudopilin PulG